MNSSYSNDATVGVTFDTPYQLNALELFIQDDGGGYPPKKIAIQYWDDAQGAFVNVANQSQTTGFKGNGAGSAVNLITFDPVTTTKLQAVMEHVNDSKD